MNLQIQNLQQRAEMGDYAAAHELGLMYYTGQGGTKDEEMALRWFEQSSKKITEDYYLMASILMKYDCQNDNYRNKAALRYLKKSSRTPMSMYALSAVYRYGILTEKSISEAFKWSVKLNDYETKAINNKASDCRFWIIVAANNGDKMMQYLLGRWLGDGIILGYSENDSIRYLDMAAEQNYPPALELLSYHYEEGDMVAQDHEYSLELMRKAGKQDPWLMNIYGDMLLRDHIKGSVCNDKSYYIEKPGYISAYEKSDIPESQYKLGLIYLSGTGVPKSESEAFEHIRSSALEGYPYALFELSSMYKMGIGTEKNQKVADILDNYMRTVSATEEYSEKGNTDRQQKDRDDTIIEDSRLFCRCPGLSIEFSDHLKVSIDWENVIECVSAMSNPELVATMLLRWGD